MWYQFVVKYWRYEGHKNIFRFSSNINNVIMSVRWDGWGAHYARVVENPHNITFSERNGLNDTKVNHRVIGDNVVGGRDSERIFPTWLFKLVSLFGY
jgi:hypothetical protein